MAKHAKVWRLKPLLIVMPTQIVAVKTMTHWTKKITSFKVLTWFMMTDTISPKSSSRFLLKIEHFPWEADVVAHELTRNGMFTLPTWLVIHLDITMPFLVNDVPFLRNKNIFFVK